MLTTRFVSKRDRVADERWTTRIKCFLFLGPGRLIVEVSRPHSHTHTHTHHTHAAGLLWTRDRPGAQTTTRQHTTLTRDRHPCPRRDSNPQPPQVSGMGNKCLGIRIFMMRDRQDGQIHNCCKHAGKPKIKVMNNTRTYSILQKCVVRKCSVCARMDGFDVTGTESSGNATVQSRVLRILCFYLLPSTRFVFRNFSRFTAPK